MKKFSGKYPINIQFIITICLFIILTMDQFAVAQEKKVKEAGLSRGLIGILYDDTNLSRPVSLWYLENLDSKKGDWEDRNDFSAKWQGFIKAPFSGDITFNGEANNGVQLQINDQLILDGWENGNSVEGRINMIKSQLYPLTLKYRQVNGFSYMRLYWQWEGQPKSLVSNSAIFFSPEDESRLQHDVDEFLAIPLSELEFDVKSIINIETKMDIDEKKRNLINLLFGQDGIPFESFPQKIETDISDPDFESLENLRRIDKLELEMEWNLNSIIYHFVPSQSINRAIIYHQGHRGKFAEGESTIKAFLRKGFDVVALSMPLKGFNRKPVVDFPRFGKLMIVSHEQISFLRPTSGHPIRFFIDPVITMVNYLQSLNFDQIMMTGISGGGWTTTMCAALDDRVLKSYPVAGSLPFYLRSREAHNNSTFGDYEQYVPEIYRIANYLDLYIMGSAGEGRKQLQILNQYDSCCFGGTGYTTYVDLIKEKMYRLGKGEFDVYLDNSHREHKISRVALEVILEDIGI